MSQVSKLNLVTDIGKINEHFLLRVTRKVQSDATIQIDNILYETDSKFIGKRVEIRYEPDWLNDIARPLLIYESSKRIGEAKVVRFHDNARVMRRFKGNRKKDVEIDIETTSKEDIVKKSVAENSISYSGMMEGGKNV